MAGLVLPIVGVEPVGPSHDGAMPFFILDYRRRVFAKKDKTVSCQSLAFIQCLGSVHNDWSHAALLPPTFASRRLAKDFSARHSEGAF